MYIFIPRFNVIFFKPLVEKIQAKVHELLEQTKKRKVIVPNLFLW